MFSCCDPDGNGLVSLELVYLEEDPADTAG